jgi:hypothetical protein
LLLICLGFAVRLGLAEWHYGEAFRMAKIGERLVDQFGRSTPEVSERTTAHLKAAGGLYPFDYRFREAAKSGRAIELAR